VQEFIKKFTASMKKNFVLLLILAVLFAEALTHIAAPNCPSVKKGSASVK